MSIKEFVKDSLSNITNKELIKKYSLKNNKEISLILSSKEGQEEIRKQQQPRTKEEIKHLNKIGNSLRECLEDLRR